MILVGPTVIHRVRVSHKRDIAVTDCGHFYSPLNVNIKDLPFTEESADQFQDRSGISLCLCFHCQDREPAWRRIYRKKMRERRASRARRKSRRLPRLRAQHVDALPRRQGRGEVPGS
jgi:hypothetical protein